MKYIRTKDGFIYKVVKEDKDSFELEGIFEKVMGCHCYMPKSRLGAQLDYKQSDTIEELCDEFVVIYNESKKFTKPFTSFYSDIIGVLKEHDLSECKIYGAIWTDKGLIYVAKMNDKGVLELLWRNYWYCHYFV